MANLICQAIDRLGRARLNYNSARGRDAGPPRIPWSIASVWRGSNLVLLRLGGLILRANGRKCDLASVHIKEYSIPTAPEGERNVCSYRVTTYVFAAPDFNRRAGSVGESAGAVSSRTLG